MLSYLKLSAVALVVSTAPLAAGSILIINGASGTSEPGTTADITTNLDTLHQAAGNTTTIVDMVPVSLAGYDQVWDIRFSNNLAITGGEQAQYLAFLQGGGGMFVMGENSGFATRNNSVLSLITAAAGDVLSFVTPASTQTVVAPFTGPNAVASVTYGAPGGVTSSGSGQYITVDGNGNGTGVAYGVGDLANAAAGALTTIFDVNFMQGNRTIEEQNLTKNLINFVDDEVDPPAIPLPASLPLVLSGLGMLALYRRKA